ncbi:MAG: DUF5686 family protein [Crocinitomicaceae bacterium]
MRNLLAIILCLFSFQLSAQHVLKGNVRDVYGQGIPGVRVALENSTYAVPTNAKGAYFLEFNEIDTLKITYSMLGFESKTDTVIVESRSQVHDVTLVEQSTELNTVEIYADNKDIAKKVIKATIDNKQAMQRQYEAFICTTYVKTGLEKENRIAFLKNEEEPEGRQKMNFTESYSVSRFEQKNTYKEEIIAHQDYSDKSANQVVVSAEFNYSNSILPNQMIEYNPYIFFEKLQDGDIDLYQNLVNIPNVCSQPLVSPIAFNAFLNYRYYLKSVFYEDEYKIYEILVDPVFNESPLFSGSLFIIDSLWIIKSMDLSINSSAMEYFKDFRIIQDYERVDGNWVAVRREFSYTINDGSDRILANTKVSHTAYDFNPDFDKKTFNNAIMTYDEEAFDRDSAYWANIRPYQLKAEEVEYIRQQDSIVKVMESDEYVDSVNTEFNKVRFWDIVLNGVGFRNREKGQEIYIKPLISQVQFLGIGGYRHSLGGSYSKEFENAQKIRVNGDADYGFTNKDLKGELGVEYTFLPKRFGSFKVRGGDIYDIVTMEQSLTNFFSRGNYVRKTFFEVSQRLEFVNGLYGRLTYDYSRRESIAGLNFAPWVDSLYAAGFWQPPQAYETYTVSIFELELLYRFKQQYVIKKGKKLIIGTEYPQLRLTYKVGVPGMFGSDVNFNFIEVGATDKVVFGTFGEMKWDIEAGTFIGSSENINNVQFIEQKFFRGSDFFFFSNPLNTLQLLDSTFNTARPYMQAYVVHHFNGAIMNKIPLINKLKLAIVAGGGALFIDEVNYRHVEVYAGLERVFKIKQQLFKVAAFYAFRQNSNPGTLLFNFKFGLDFFNSWTNEWSW